MLYLSGHIWDTMHADAAELGMPIGGMFSPNMGNRIPAGIKWTADTGLYNAETRRAWEADFAGMWAEYCTWILSKTEEQRARLIFANLPDVFGDASGTFDWGLIRANKERLQLRGVAVAYTLQPGSSPDELRFAAECDAVFIGGPDEWQHSEECANLIREAKLRGQWVHRGRVNTRRRFDLSREQGLDSVDGTLLAYGRDVNLPILASWHPSPRRLLPRGAVISTSTVIHCDSCGDPIDHAEINIRDRYQSGAHVCRDCSAMAVER